MVPDFMYGDTVPSSDRKYVTHQTIIIVVKFHHSMPSFIYKLSLAKEAWVSLITIHYMKYATKGNKKSPQYKVKYKTMLYGNSTDADKPVDSRSLISTIDVS